MSFQEITPAANRGEVKIDLSNFDSTLGPIGQAALEYAERGWKVFPLRTGTKSGHYLDNGHNGASSDIEQVRAWWNRWPDANIGLNLKASGLVAVDPDIYKPECGWGEFCAENGIAEIDTLTQRSASGGWHYIFECKPDDEFPGTACKEVEIKHKGYIMLDPSTFEGKPYVWHNDDDPAPVPDWVPRKAVRPKRSLEDVASRPVASNQTIAKALDALPAAILDYDEWLKVGQGLHDHSGGSDDGFQMWADWSKKDQSRFPSIPDLAVKWRGFTEEKGVTLGTLFFLAEKYCGNWRLPDWAQGWVFNEKLCEYHHIATKHSIKERAFNLRYSGRPECFKVIDGKPKKLLPAKVIEDDIQSVANVMYWPGAGDLLDCEALTYVNTYKPHSVTPRAPVTYDGEEAIAAIEAHAEYLTQNEREKNLLLDFLAWVYQNPGKKVNWAILMHGIQGNGKSFWVELMKRLLGANARDVSGNVVMERFTEWADEAQFIAIEEIRVPSESKYAVLEKLKPYITNLTVNIEGKNKPVRIAPNFASYMLLSNHDDALPLDDDDRRYCVIQTKQKSKADLPVNYDEYFNTLFGYLYTEIEAIAYYFHSRQVSAQFKPKGRAPDTVGRARMMDATKSQPRFDLEEAIADFQSDMINERIVYLTALKERADYEDRKLPHSTQIGRELKAMGYEKALNEKGKGHFIASRERSIYYAPDLVTEAQAVAAVTQYITGAPF